MHWETNVVCVWKPSIHVQRAGAFSTFGIDSSLRSPSPLSAGQQRRVYGCNTMGSAMLSTCSYRLHAGVTARNVKRRPRQIDREHAQLVVRQSCGGVCLHPAVWECASPQISRPNVAPHKPKHRS